MSTSSIRSVGLTLARVAALAFALCVLAYFVYQAQSRSNPASPALIPVESNDQRESSMGPEQPALTDNVAQPDGAAQPDATMRSSDLFLYSSKSAVLPVDDPVLPTATSPRRFLSSSKSLVLDLVETPPKPGTENE